MNREAANGRRRYHTTSCESLAEKEIRSGAGIKNGGRSSAVHVNPFISPSVSKNLVKVPNIIVMVGLPARGKTYIAKKLCRYLNWTGITTKVFNLGDYRRLYFKEHSGCNEFFNPQNVEMSRVRQHCADLALADVCRYLEEDVGQVAIFDATNSTRERRAMLRSSLIDSHMFRLLFVESVCDDPLIIEANIQDVKVNSPDYKDIADKEVAKEDFQRRIEHYRQDYQPLDPAYDGDLSFIKVYDVHLFDSGNAGDYYTARFDHVLTLKHGESEFNRMGRLGGDSPLSQQGLMYAKRLSEYFQQEQVPDLRVWSSQKIRAVQTACLLGPCATYMEHWKALDEIDAGICEGLTYLEISERYPEQFHLRDQDKFHYRYPSGESYEDLVARVEPVIMELERQENVLVVAHQAVLRCLLAYFLDKDWKEMPYLRVPLHTVVKLTPVAYGCKMELIKFDVEAVDTHRDRPTASSGAIVSHVWNVESLGTPDLEQCRSPPS